MVLNTFGWFCNTLKHVSCLLNKHELFTISDTEIYMNENSRYVNNVKVHTEKDDTLLQKRKKDKYKEV